MADKKTYMHQGMNERDAVMAELVDMKRTKSEKKNQSASPVGLSDDHPYGLSIQLEDESLTKLGLSELPKPGETLCLHAHAVVESVNESSSHEGGSSRSVRLQITRLKIDDSEAAESPEEEADEPDEPEDDDEDY